MALQTSGAISLANIQTEFGGAHPISISEYYGSDDVPTSGTISLNDFYGTSDVLPYRGVFGLGLTTASSNIIDYITIATTGNSTDFGDLTVARNAVGSVASESRGVFGSGAATGVLQNVMDYITIATTGNASDFGDLTLAQHSKEGLASTTRGVFAGGYAGNGGTPAPYSNILEYITIASTGNATDFGDMLTGNPYSPACVASDTRGVLAAIQGISYITIASTGNAISFGTMTENRHSPGGVSSDTRGVFAGGYTGLTYDGNTNVIDYITIASTGNATDFGDLSTANMMLMGASGGVRGVFGGGQAVGSAAVNRMEYITIATTGNVTDFGDLSAACSTGSGLAGT